MFTSKLIDQIIKGRCTAFAEIMGMHKAAAAELTVSVFLPGARTVEVVSSSGKKVLAVLQCLHAEGLFCGQLPGKKIVAYRLRVSDGTTTQLLDDPYRFGGNLDAAEVQLFCQGRHEAAWHLLGAHPRILDGVEGVHFALWAPTAKRVSVLLERSRWDGRVHVMYPHADAGLWELFVPGLPLHAAYKFEVMNKQLETQVLSFDPFAGAVELQPASCSRVEAVSTRAWRDQGWLLMHSNQSGQAMPVSILELVLPDSLLESGVRWPQLAAQALPKLKQQGFTWLLLRDAQACAVKSGQRQPALLTATPALGSNSELQDFVEQAHELEVAVIWDFSLVAVAVAHGLALAAGEPIDWDTQGGALMSAVCACLAYWHTHMHIDGFRLRDIDQLLTVVPSKALAGRKPLAGSAIDPYAREWLAALLSQLRERFPSLLLLADTAMALPELTRSQRLGGLGFDFRMDATNSVLLRQPGEQAVLSELTALVQAWQDGNALQQMTALAPAANLPEDLLHLLLLMLWTLPARKLLQLECRLSGRRNGQSGSGHDPELQLAGLSPASLTLLHQFNLLYLQCPSLYEQDASHEGINVLLSTPDLCVFERVSRHAAESLLILVNLGEGASESPGLRLPRNRRYQLLCGVGAQALPAEFSTGTASLGLKVTLPARTGAIYSLAS